MLQKILNWLKKRPLLHQNSKVLYKMPLRNQTRKKQMNLKKLLNQKSHKTLINQLNLKKDLHQSQRKPIKQMTTRKKKTSQNPRVRRRIQSL
jgi:hypothetical protein